MSYGDDDDDDGDDDGWRTTADAVGVVDAAIRGGIRGIIQARDMHGFVGPGGVALPQPKPHCALDISRRGRRGWSLWDRYDPNGDVRTPRCLATCLTERRAMALAFGVDL